MGSACFGRNAFVAFAVEVTFELSRTCPPVLLGSPATQGRAGDDEG
jgi:hypothetical protein